MTAPAHAEASLYACIGNNIRTARAARGLSQARLADSVGLTRTSITNLEQGRQQVPLHTLYAVARALQVSIRDLIPDVGPPTNTSEIDAADVDRWTGLLRDGAEVAR